MGVTSLDFNRISGALVFFLIVMLISIPILYVLKMWAYNTTFKKMQKAKRKRRLEKQDSSKKYPPFFLLERQKIRAPKRYVIYYYGYLLVVVVLILSAWLRAHNIFVDATQWLWTFKLLLDAVIGAIYLSQTHPK